MLHQLAKMVLAALVVASIAEAAAGCRRTPTRTELDLETIAIGGTTYAGTIPRIDIFNTSDSTLPDWYRAPPSWLDSVDYSKYFVVVAYYGVQATTDQVILITNAWEAEETVYIRAQFIHIPVATVPAYSSPSHTVKVGKKKMGRLGQLTFKLLDDYGRERASTTASISQD